MNTPDSKLPEKDPVKAIDSVIELAFGNQQEAEKMTAAEVRADLKTLGVDTEKGWLALQQTIRSAQGKIRLESAREERLKSRAELGKPASVIDSARALIDEITGMITMTGGKASVFARKAESMPIEDLRALRDQLLRTTARAAKKRRNED